MTNQEIAQKTADLLDQAVLQVQKAVDLMTADQLINLTVAIEDAEPDLDQIQTILDEVQESNQTQSESLTVPEIKKEIKQLGAKLIAEQEPLTQVWSLIGQLDAPDWHMIYPSLDTELLKALYLDATDKQTDQVTRSQADQIHAYAQSFILEHVVMYENTLWRVSVPVAPHDLVGIQNDQGHKLVPRRELQSLQEHVLGMTQMPAIARIKELAGINASPVTQPQVAHGMNMHNVVPAHAHTQDWVNQLRMHMTEIEQLAHVPEHAQELELHVRALSRKASDAVKKISKSP